jgi:hypothetical protein
MSINKAKLTEADIISKFIMQFLVLDIKTNKYDLARDISQAENHDLEA